MAQSKFHIYNASAGAGKTYSLVRNYLRICLASPSPSSFRSILAITFTNKAAQEMKDRIISALKAFSQYPDCGNDKSMFEDLAQELNLESSEMKRRSHESLRLILHQYSAFSVSTIDKFTNRLIRTFAQDLKLSANYEVELDNLQILGEAIDKMLSDIEEGSALSKILIQFLNFRLEEGRSPRTDLPLLNMGKSLFQEDAIYPISLLKDIDSEEFMNIRSKLYARNKALEKQVAEEADKALKIIDQACIPHPLFNRSYLPKYLIKSSKGIFSLPSASVLSQINAEVDLYAKSKAKEGELLIDPIQSTLLKQCHNLLEVIRVNYSVYQISKLVISNILSLAVLTEIERNLEEVKTDENRLPIGEFNKLVSEKLREQPAAFMYERMGDRYQHYFIDEFQDTSILQWRNMLPLINNAMSQGGSGMLVGDGKQSIYRWRGGEVEQFLNLSNDLDEGNKIQVNGQEIELYSRATVNLPSNWRSRKNIVAFNNNFFPSILDLKDDKGMLRINNEAHKDLFQNAGQEAQGKDGGYIEIRRTLYEKENEEAYHLFHAESCLNIVKEALERGYSLKDIAILNRRKSDSAVLSKYLVSKGIGVVSPDSLTADQSISVTAMISFLQFYLRPDDKEARLPFLNWYYEERLSGKVSKHEFLKTWTETDTMGLLNFLEMELDDFTPQIFSTLSLSEKIFELSRIFALDIQNDPFLQAFSDAVLNFEQHYAEGESGFLRWWSKHSHELVVDLPDSLDAVRMMTIHKSKGLEFPIVILAYADWRAFSEQSSDTWLKLPSEKFFGLPVAKVGLRKDENPFPGMEEYQYLYSKNQEDIILDNLNLLYVALTRPEDELYILGTEGREDSQRISCYLQHFMEMENGEEQMFWSSGEKVSRIGEPSNEAKDTIDYQRVSRAQKLAVTIDAPKDWHQGESDATAWGKKVHTVLSEVGLRSDAEGVIERLIQKGHVQTEQMEKLVDMVNAVVVHEDLAPFFEGEFHVLNESEILIPGGTSMRPDRILIKDNQFHILEYKTGKGHPAHMDQLHSYADVLMSMGFQKGEIMLVYLGEEIKLVKG